MNLGKLNEEPEGKRGFVSVPYASVRSRDTRIYPGEKVKFISDSEVEVTDSPDYDGIVDPFYEEAIDRYDTFLVLLRIKNENPV